jgi:hypothetical protein
MSKSNRIVIPRSGSVEVVLGVHAFVIDTWRFAGELREIQQRDDGSGSTLPEMQGLVARWGGPPDVTGEETIKICSHVISIVSAEQSATPADGGKKD